MSEEKPKINDNPVLYTMSNGWGDAISFFDPKQFDDPNFEGPFRITGHKARKPKVGDMLKAEMKKSYLYFVFTKMEYCGNPHDMFFADAMPYRQEIKETGEVIGWELPEFKPQPKTFSFL